MDRLFDSAGMTMDFQGTLMEVYMRGRGIGKPNTTSEGKKDLYNSSIVHVSDNHQGRSEVPAPIHTTRNWFSMPPLNGFNFPSTQVLHQEFKSNWREEVGIYHLRITIRRDIEQIVCRNRNSNQWNQVKLQNFCDDLEEMLFMEASTKAEYENPETLRNRLKSSIISIKSRISYPGEINDQVKQVEKGIMGIISQSMPPLRKLHNDWCSAGLPTYQQGYLDRQFPLPVQGVLSTKNISGPLADDRLEGLKLSSNSSQNCVHFVDHQFQNYQPPHANQNHIQSQALLKLYRNGDAVNSRDYIDELAASSESSMIGTDPFCYQHQSREHTIVHSNFETCQASRQHYAKEAIVPCTFDAGSAKPRKTTSATHKVDVPAREFLFKRRKIDDTSNLPSSINITGHQALEGIDKPSVTSFSGYEIPPEWGPIPLHDSPQRTLLKDQQCPGMSYESSVTEVDMDEHYDSALSRELVGSSKQEPKVNSMIHKGKTEEEKSLRPHKHYSAGFMSANLNTKDFWSKDLSPKYKIEEPDVHMETPIGQAAIIEVDKILGSVSDQSKIRGASLTEILTPDQLEVHVASLKQWFGEAKPKVDECENDNACQLCGVEKLFFAISCFLCGILIKKNDTYHSASRYGVECRCCNKCFKSEGEKSSVPGLHIDKEKISLDIDPSYQEPFVQCDRCDSWQHHSCALFNNERNIGGKAEYICPKCYIQEIKNGLRVPLPRSVIPGAIDLPRTKLSDFIEHRLFSRLKQERNDRAKGMGKNSDEVPGAEDLVVRVVLSVKKTLIVKQELLDVFKEENYPKEFPYTSKVILLFQKIDGVDVCLFGLYVQEYGSRCAHPNQHSVYISYLDSVKYFRPDGIKAATGESLRTFVYREILVGYLDYCKTRGFSRCYIWSCPPSKADHYIFYCRPEIQRSLNAGNLRDWYGKMLDKATSEKIVANFTNLYDQFFVSKGEHKVTAARLPYFDGDYWPLTAEAVLKKLVDVKSPPIRKARKQKLSLEAVGCTDASGNPPVDDQLMKELGKEIKKRKENFIIMYLETQHTADTDRDEDEVIEGNIFDGRDNFLNFCAKNHYQFDNLQRAKHATMMILYQLHKSKRL